MMRRRIAIFLIALAFVSRASAQTTAPSDGVDQLIADLGATEWSVRQAAQQKLVELGPRAAEQLKRAAREARTEEVRQSAQSILARIADEALIGPSIITMHLRDASPREAFDELARQAGIPPMRAMPSSMWSQRNWPDVTIDIDAEPFWIALRKLSDATGVELRVWQNEARLMQAGGPGLANGVIGPGWFTGRTMLSGAFVITLQRAHRSSTIDFGRAVGNGVGADDAPGREFSLSFYATGEPRMKILAASFVAHLDEATDDLGNSLLVPKDAPEAQVPAGRLGDKANGFATASVVPGAGESWQFVAALAEPPAGKTLGKKLVTLRGGINAVVRTHAETLEVPNVLSAENVTTASPGAGLKLTVKKVKTLRDRYEVSAIISRDRSREAVGADDPMARMADWQRLQQSLGDIRLIDESGRSLSNANLSSSGGEDSVEMTMTFARRTAATDANAAAIDEVTAPPSTQPTNDLPKLSWTITTQTREIVIPFEFKDVPLP